MKTKIKRHYRSVVSVLLSVCMLVSCIAVGLIGTDAAKVTDSDNVAAASTDEAVGASVDVDARVGSGAGYILKSDNDNPSRATDTGATVTRSGSKYTATLPISLFSANRNYYIMLSSSDSYTNSFYQGENITVTKTSASTQISGYGSQSRDAYRMARFSLSKTEGISGIKVEVSSNTYTLSTVSSATTTYSVTVDAGANGSVVAGSTAITAGNSATVSVAQNSNISLVATPVQGYSFKEWTVSGCSVGSTTSASTTLSATANGGTVTATYIKNATAKRRIYYDNSSTNWTTPYAYAELSDGTPCLGTDPGTAMSHDSTDDVWYIDVNAEVAKIQFSNNGANASGLRTDIPDYLNPEFYDYTGSGSGGSWKPHSAKLQSNEKNAVLGDTITGNEKLYSNISATFYDYFTDHEVGDTWYSSINAASDGWIDTVNSPLADDNKAESYWTTINRNPYKALNKALSAYAKQNSIAHPLYFGAFNEGGYHNPGYYKSSVVTKGQKVNDSNFLSPDARTDTATDSNRWYRALPGLAGTSIFDGTIYYANASGENGVPMVLFDKQWLLSRTSTGSNDAPSHTIYFDPGYFEYTAEGVQHHASWANDNADIWAAQQDGKRDWWGLEKLSVNDSGVYEYSFDNSADRIKFYRVSHNGNITIDHDGKASGDIWDTSNNVEGTNGSFNGKLARMVGWKLVDSTANYYGQDSVYPYEGSLAEIVNSNFPVRKTTQENATYYEFNSNNGTDNVYFNNLTDETLTMQYAGQANNQVSTGRIMNGYNAGYGFFPFDKQANNSGYGKDLAFGMKLEIEFTLGPDGQIYGSDNQWHDQKFNFSGDDDLWVYVDDHLVLDLGGDHKMTEATINFHEMKVTTTHSVDPNINSSRNGSFGSWFNNDDTSKIHKMTIYYMERGMQESNLKFGFSFYPVDNKFVTTEEMSYDGVNPALASDVETLAATDSIVVTHYADTNETPSTLATNKPYRLNAATTDSNTGDAGTYTLGDGDKATFLKQFHDGEAGYVASISDKPQNFKLSTADGASNVFTYNTIVKGVTDVKNDRVIPVTGTDKNIFTFRTLKDPKYDTDPTDIQADLLSTIKTKNLMITKDLVGAEDTTNTFKIKIEIDLDGAGSKKGYQVYELPYLLNGTSGTLLNTGLINIKKDDVIIITGIPVNAKVRVSEDTSSINSVYEYNTTEVFPQSGVGTTAYDAYSEGNFKGAEFTVLTDDFVTVINKKKPTYSLNVKKETDTDDTTGSYDFYVMKLTGTSPVTLTPIADGSYELINSDGTSGTVTATAGKISLTKNQQFVISNIHSNDVYLVYEDTTHLPDNYVYDTTVVTGTSTSTINPTVNSTAYKGAQVTFAATDIHVVVTNKTKGYDVTIKKKLVSGTSAKLYTVNVKAGEAAYSGEYEIYDKNGTQITTRTMTDGAVDLGVDEYVVLKAVAENTELEVTEEKLSSTYVRAFHYGYTSVKVGDSTLTTQDNGGITATTNPKKIDNGVSLTVTAATSVEVYNKPWTYFIKYQYPGYLQRYYPNVTANQWYDYKGAFTDSDFEEEGLMTIGTEKATGSETYPCPKFKGYDDSYNTTETDVKDFITARAPYQDNFMTTMTWDPVLSGNKPNTNIHYYPLQDTQNVYVEVTADADAQKGIQVYFKLPYEFESWVEQEDTSLDPKAGTDGKVMRKTDPYYYRVDTQYGLWVTKNRSQDRNTAKWVEAAPEIYDAAGNRYVFRHWEMKSVGKNLRTNVESQYIGQNPRQHALKDEYEYKRCYSRAFNMTLYQDSYVEPIYILDSDSDASLTPKERETKDTGISTQYGGAFINFLENSRNQWNDQGGILYGNNGENNSDRVNQGDRVFSDFLFSFNYNDVMLQSSLGKYKTETVTVDGEEVTKRVFEPYKYNGQEIKFKYGFVLEKADNITDTNANGDLSDDIKTQADYRALYNSAKTDSAVEGQTQMQAAIAYITNNTNSSGNFLLKEEYSAGALDNKNEIEYSTSIPVISHSTGAALPYKNYVYRAYAYLKDYTIAGGQLDYTWNGEPISDEDWTAIRSGSHNGSVLEISAPVYFTIYNIASVDNGTPFHDKGGQS